MARATAQDVLKQRMAVLICAASVVFSARLKFVELSSPSPTLAPATAFDWSGGMQPDTASAWPSISVMLITHERASFLPHALDSIAAQDYPPERFEVIIVDDSAEGGADAWRELSSCCAARQLRGRLRYLHAAPRPCRARLGTKRNTGASAARGEVVAIWDDDDFYSPARLRLQAAVIARGEADIVMLDQSSASPLLHYFDASVGAFSQVSRSSLVQPCAMAYRRALWGPGASRYPPSRDAMEDLIFFDSLLAHGARVGTATAPWLRVRHAANVVADYSAAGTREETVDVELVASRVGLSAETVDFLLGIGASDKSPLAER